MGTGNYSHSDGSTVIIDLFDGIEYDADDPYLHEIETDDAREDLWNCIADCVGQRWTMRRDEWRRDSRDCKIVADNAHHQVWTHEDSYGHVFVTFGVREDVDEDMEALAQATYQRRAQVFFDKLQEQFPNHTYVATSAWTSARRTLSTEGAAA